MLPSKLRSPSPALVLSGVALFAAVGGTGYAASSIGGSSPPPATIAKAKSKPVTKAQVNKLVAGYFKKHRAALKGATGAPGAPGAPGHDGAAGAPGGTGPQGPGAGLISGSTSSAEGTVAAGTAGPWTFTLQCPAGGPAGFHVTGPGTEGGTTSLGGAGAATTFVGPPSAIGGGTTATVGTGAQMSQTLFLQNGSTRYEVKMLMTAANGGLFEVCTVVGDAIPIPG